MSLDPIPKGDWAFHSKRLIDLLQHQTSSLRRRQVIEAFVAKERGGAYWGIQSKVGAFGIPDPVTLSTSELALADMETRLTKISRDDQRGIMKIGYATCDAAIRSPQCHWSGHVDIRLATQSFDIE